MRYDKRVVFKVSTEGVYNADTGNYDNPIDFEYPRLAHVSEPIVFNAGGMLSGTSEAGAIKVRVQTPVVDEVTEVWIDGEAYTIIIIRKNRRFFVVSKVVR